MRVYSKKGSEIINHSRRTTTWGKSQDLWRQMWGGGVEHRGMHTEAVSKAVKHDYLCLPPPSLPLFVHTHTFLAASTWLPSSFQTRFNWLPKRGSLGINTTEQRFFFFSDKMRENRGRKDSTHSYPSGTGNWPRQRQELVTSPHAHCTPELLASCFLSLSLSHQKKQASWARVVIIINFSFVIMEWKCVVDVAPGGNVSVWLQRSDALPASRCFMFPPARSLERSARRDREQGKSWTCSPRSMSPERI